MPDPAVTPIPTVDLVTADSQITMRVLRTKGPEAVPYIEYLEYAEDFPTDGNISSTRFIGCLWEDRQRLRKDMAGTSIYVAGNICDGQVSNIYRLPPEQHPEYPALYCERVQLVEPQGVPTTLRTNIAKALTSPPNYNFVPLQSSQRSPTTNMVTFNLAKMAVIYTSRDYDIFGQPLVVLSNEPGQPPAPTLRNQAGYFSDPVQGQSADENGIGSGQGELGRYVSRYPKSAAENLSYPGGAFRFVSDGPNNFIPESPATTLATQELQYIWRQVPGVPWPAIRACVGKCNLYAFDNGRYPTQTLLCLAPEIRPRYRTAAFDWVYDITYIFIEKDKTHNALFRAKVGDDSIDPKDTPGFEKIIGRDGTTLATKTADFATLFQLP